MKKNARTVPAIIVASVISAGFSWLLLLVLAIPEQPVVQWTMVNVNYGSKQGDAHIIRVRGGETILIDAGYPGPAQKKLLPFLRSHAISHIDRVFITHPHKDHYGGLRPLLQAGIDIGEIYFNQPDKSVCDGEKPWGCDYQDLLDLRAELHERQIPVREAEKGMTFDLGSGTTIDVLYAFDGINTPVGPTGVNDLSLIMMLRYREKSILFTGDLNRRIGEYISGFPSVIRADILKVPHHGAESLPDSSFFDAVRPHFALVPAPKQLWLSERSERTRNWFQEHAIPVYVNGISGDIRVALLDNDIGITTESQLFPQRQEKEKQSPGRRQ